MVKEVGLFKIEKGVPVPKPQASKVKYPFDDMDVGDSFRVVEVGTMRSAVFAKNRREAIKAVPGPPFQTICGAH